MRKSSALVILAFAVMGLCVTAAAKRAVCGGSDLLIDEAIRVTDSIAPGSTRSFVERFFIEDGGPQQRIFTRYSFRKCHSIKVNITFSLPNHLDSNDSLPGDTVKEVSKPYLEYPLYD